MIISFKILIVNFDLKKKLENNIFKKNSIFIYVLFFIFEIFSIISDLI